MNTRRVKIVAAWTAWSASAILVIGILLGLLGWAVVSTQHASDRRDRQIASLIQAVRDSDHDAARDRRTAAQNQRLLLDYTKALADRQDALLTYLRAHGIHVPARFITEVPAPRIVTIHPHRGPSPKHSGGGTSSRSPRPTGPGKSGHAPGHRKHRPHGHKHH
ncbi:hypothetical protein [Nocardioides montaniterrae]